MAAGIIVKKEKKRENYLPVKAVLKAAAWSDIYSSRSCHRGKKKGVSSKLNVMWLDTAASTCSVQQVTLRTTAGESQDALTSSDLSPAAPDPPSSPASIAAEPRRSSEYLYVASLE